MFIRWEILCSINIGAGNKILETGLPKLSINWTYGYRATTSADDCITRLASEAEHLSVGERLNWAAIPDSMKNK